MSKLETVFWYHVFHDKFLRFIQLLIIVKLKNNNVVFHKDNVVQSKFLFHISDIMVGMGYSQEEIQESLSKMKYDEITATYLLLGRKSSEVSKVHTVIHLHCI